MNSFKEIAGMAVDIEGNKDNINNQMLNVLKKLHLYWNTLRFSNQFGKIKQDTKLLIRNMLQDYLVKRDFLQFIAKTLLKSITQAYYRFTKANYMYNILASPECPMLLAQQIIYVYKSVAEILYDYSASNTMQVREI